MEAEELPEEAHYRDLKRNIFGDLHLEEGLGEPLDPAQQLKVCAYEKACGAIGP